MNVIEFPNNNAPDPEHVCIVVENGKPVKWYEFVYSFTADEGREYSFRLWARDMEHAEEMLQAVRATGRLDGQLFAEIPA